MPAFGGLGTSSGWSMEGFSHWPRVFRFATHYLGGQIGLCRVRWTGYEGRGAYPHLGAWAQVRGGRWKAFPTGPVCSASLHTTWAVELASAKCAGPGASLELHRRRHFRKESKSGSDRSRWSFQSLPAPAIPIRVA